MEKRYFGTDGIRGRVGEYPITADFMLKLGWAAGRVLAGRGTNNQVLIGKDTRLSNYMFESALEAGLSAAGVNIQLLGPMPTPGIAYLTRALRANAGIVISASHNPHYDNGIKFFSREGRKLDDEAELAIESMLDQPLTTVDTRQLGKAYRMEDARGRYIEFCKHSLRNGSTLSGLKLVVDCANGAAYQVAPAVFQELGAEVIRVGAQPDGVNINVDCGSLYPEALQRKVVDAGADAGIALDGDGDRVLMVDERGELVDGDELLWIIARDRLEEGSLSGPVVGTLMSNLGLELALKELGVGFERAKVGDRYVLERLLATGGTLGGETSGHIVCLDRTTTGDGIVSALQVLGRAAALGQSLGELRGGMSKLPQLLVNVPVEQRRDPMGVPAIERAVRDVEAELGESGRVLLRASGTEPVIRVMVEGAEHVIVERLTGQLADRVAEALRA
ncbi:MAG: phosphoglucosamine mutase [Ectothiorhodospiraceae bacterium]|jgi:phosphoglucosamine mutase